MSPATKRASDNRCSIVIARPSTFHPEICPKSRSTLIHYKVVGEHTTEAINGGMSAITQFNARVPRRLDRVLVIPILHMQVPKVHISLMGTLVGCCRMIVHHSHAWTMWSVKSKYATAIRGIASSYSPVMKRTMTWPEGTIKRAQTCAAQNTHLDEKESVN